MIKKDLTSNEKAYFSGCGVDFLFGYISLAIIQPIIKQLIFFIRCSVFYPFPCQQFFFVGHGGIGWAGRGQGN